MAGDGDSALNDKSKPRLRGLIGPALEYLGRLDKFVFSTIVGLRIFSNLLDLLALYFLSRLVGALSSPGFEAENGRVLLPVGLFDINLGAPAAILIVVTLFLFRTMIAILLVRRQATFLAKKEAKYASKVVRALLAEKRLSGERGISRADGIFAALQGPREAVTVVLGNFANILADSSLLIILLSYFFYLSPALTALVGLYFLLVVTLYQLTATKLSISAAREAASGHTTVTQQLLEIIDSLVPLTVARRLPKFIAELERWRRTVAFSYARQTVLASVPRQLIESALLLGAGSAAAVALASGSLFQSVDLLVVFLVGGLRMISVLVPIQNSVSAVLSSSNPSQLSREMFARSVHSDEASKNPISEEPFLDENFSPGRLDLIGVSFKYPGEKQRIFSGIDLSVSGGEFVAIVGPSGVGKSTLASLLSGYLRPNQGSVLLDGIDVNSVLDSNPGSLAFVPQSVSLISGSIANNVALSRNEADLNFAEVERSLEAVGLSGLSSAIGDSTSALIGAGRSFSGGELQRIGIARALYSRARVIILDEFTSALDEESEVKILSLLNRIRGRVTLIFVTHRHAPLQIADSVYHLSEDGGLLKSS